MENLNNTQDLEAQYKLASLNQKSIEDSLEKTQKEINLLTESFDIDLKSLNAAQQITNELKQRLFESKKNTIKEMLNTDTFKKAFGGTGYFLSSLKDKVITKGKEVKNYIDHSSLNKLWIEEKYHEYKLICIAKGEEFKSKEDFKKIALAYKDFEDELGDLKLHRILSKVNKEAENAKDTLKNIWVSLGAEEKITEFLSKDKDDIYSLNQKFQTINQDIGLIDKKIIFSNWLSFKDIQPSTTTFTSIDILYKDYIQFVNDMYSNDIATDMVYQLQNGTFVSALKRNFENLTYNKETKSISLSV